MYIAGRSERNARMAISSIKASRSAATMSRKGDIAFLHLALDDLTTIKPAVDRFTSAESRLDVLFNNAGVSNPPRGSVSAQGHELQMATNCLGHYLFTGLLSPILERTAAVEEEVAAGVAEARAAAVRVIFTSSIIVDTSAPVGGIRSSDILDPLSLTQQQNYATTKTMNWFLAALFARRLGSKGGLCLTQNPGNLKTPLLRHMPWIVGFVTSPILYQPVMGAYTELWAGLSEELSLADGGKYVVPWGRLHPGPRQDIVSALDAKEHGGSAAATAKWIAEYRESQTMQ